MPENIKSQPGAAREGLTYCNRLFAIERELAQATPKEHYEEREKKSQPILQEFHAWLKQTRPKVLPKSALGKALQYCLNQWGNLTNFMQNGLLEIDNNRSEISIKPFVFGRKTDFFPIPQIRQQPVLRYIVW